MTAIEFLPSLNAFLNGMASLFLLQGWFAIRQGNQVRHKKRMVAALVCSALFLSSYLYYHYNAQAMTPYQGEGFGKIFYYFILATHVPLATIMVPFILAAVFFAIKGQFERHKKIVKWVWPVWMYVSVTGVIIYFMLYVL